MQADMALPAVTPAAVLPAPATAGGAPDLVPGKAPLLTPLPFCSTVRTALHTTHCGWMLHRELDYMCSPRPTLAMTFPCLDFVIADPHPVCQGVLAGSACLLRAFRPRRSAAVTILNRARSLQQTDRHGLFGVDTEAKRPLTALMGGTPLVFGGLYTADRPATGGSAATGFSWHVRVGLSGLSRTPRVRPRNMFADAAVGTCTRLYGAHARSEAHRCTWQRRTTIMMSRTPSCAARYRAEADTVNGSQLSCYRTI